jgi:acyl carrier protein
MAGGEAAMSTDSRPPSATPPRGQTPSQIVERVAKLVAELSGRDTPAPDDDLAGLGIDSVARLELLARLEADFDIELTEDFIGEFRSVAHISRIVRDARGLSVRDHE